MQFGLDTFISLPFITRVCALGSKVKKVMAQNVTNASFLAFLTHLTQIFSILLHLKAYKSTCNICVKCNTENMPFTEPKKNLKNQVNPN